LKPRAASGNPSAAHNNIAVVEHGGLSGSDCALRLIEGNENLVGVPFLDNRRRRLVTMTNLYRNPLRLKQLLNGNQICAARDQRLRIEILLLADNHLALVALDLEDVQR